MTQTNTQTGMVRSLRRRVGGGGGAAGGAAPPAAAHHGGKKGKAKKNKHSSRHRHGSSGGQPGTELAGVTYYDHTAEISADKIRQETQWKLLPAGTFDPTECDVITTEPFGTGPVVELGCSGSVRGTRCVFRQDSIESALRSNHGRCPICNEHYAALSKGDCVNVARTAAQLGSCSSADNTAHAVCRDSGFRRDEHPFEPGDAVQRVRSVIRWNFHNPIYVWQWDSIQCHAAAWAALHRDNSRRVRALRSPSCLLQWLQDRAPRVAFQPSSAVRLRTCAVFRADGVCCLESDYRYYPNTAEGRKAVSSHIVTVIARPQP